MKKITFIALMLFSAVSNAQTTYAIYTENPAIGAGVSSLRFSNGQGYAATEPTTAPYEGTKNFMFTYNGTSSYFHGILFPRNAANTADTTVDLSAYSYYNVSLKTASPHPFYIRIRGNAITAKVLINPASNSYNFTNDNQWHFMSIPLSAFVAEAGTFSMALLTEIFVIRSENSIATVVGSSNDFQIDNIYASTTQVLGTAQPEKAKLNLYPNPAFGNVTVSAENTIENITVYNVVGQKILTLSPKENTATFDISSLTSGIYVAMIESDGKISASKFVKK